MSVGAHPEAQSLSAQGKHFSCSMTRGPHRPRPAARGRCRHRRAAARRRFGPLSAVPDRHRQLDLLRRGRRAVARGRPGHPSPGVRTGRGRGRRPLPQRVPGGQPAAPARVAGGRLRADRHDGEQVQHRHHPGGGRLRAGVCRDPRHAGAWLPARRQPLRVDLRHAEPAGDPLRPAARGRPPRALRRLRRAAVRVPRHLAGRRSGRRERLLPADRRPARSARRDEGPPAQHVPDGV